MLHPSCQSHGHTAAFGEKESCCRATEQLRRWRVHSLPGDWRLEGNVPVKQLHSYFPLQNVYFTNPEQLLAHLQLDLFNNLAQPPAAHRVLLRPARWSQPHSPRDAAGACPGAALVGSMALQLHKAPKTKRLFVFSGFLSSKQNFSVGHLDSVVKDVI